MKKKDKTVIGRYDHIDLPLLDLIDLDAKIDTGAYTSAIHCSKIELVKMDGKKVLHFVLLDPTHPAYNRRSFYVETFQQRRIKNSFGQSENRYIITTPFVIFGRTIKTEFSLSYRGNLKFPVLIGRRFLQKARLVVDVAKKNLSYHKKTEASKKQT